MSKIDFKKYKSIFCRKTKNTCGSRTRSTEPVEWTKIDKIIKNQKNIVGNQQNIVKISKKKYLSNKIEKEIGKKAFIFSSITRDGIEDLKKELFEKCSKINDK